MGGVDAAADDDDDEFGAVELLAVVEAAFEVAELDVVVVADARGTELGVSGDENITRFDDVIPLLFGFELVDDEDDEDELVVVNVDDSDSLVLFVLDDCIELVSLI